MRRKRNTRNPKVPTSIPKQTPRTSLHQKRRPSAAARPTRKRKRRTKKSLRRRKRKKRSPKRRAMTTKRKSPKQRMLPPSQRTRRQSQPLQKMRLPLPLPPLMTTRTTSKRQTLFYVCMCVSSRHRHRPLRQIFGGKGRVGS